jgi:hypothetical protein
MLIYGLVINPEFHDLILENALSKMPAEQADAAAGMMKFFTGPIWMAVMVLIMSPIIGTIISLIIAIFVKRAPQTPAAGSRPLSAHGNERSRPRIADVRSHCRADQALSLSQGCPSLELVERLPLAGTP